MKKILLVLILGLIFSCGMALAQINLEKAEKLYDLAYEHDQLLKLDKDLDKTTSIELVFFGSNISSEDYIMNNPKEFKTILRPIFEKRILEIEQEVKLMTLPQVNHG